MDEDGQNPVMEIPIWCDLAAGHLLAKPAECIFDQISHFLLLQV
jgi:hypothetical protein